MRKQRQVGNKVRERTITEVTRYQVNDTTYFVKLRLYCPQMDEIVTADTELGNKADIGQAWIDYQGRANRYAHKFGEYYQESN